MRGFGASSVSHQHGKGTKCLLFQGIFLGKGLWGKVGHRHVVRHHAVWGKIPGKMPLGKSATVVLSNLANPMIRLWLNGLGSPFGFETSLSNLANPMIRLWLNGLWSPFEFETR